MEYITLIGAVTFVHLLAVMSPGPDLIMAIRNSLLYSQRIGVLTAIGFGAGISVHIFYSYVGLALIISQSIFLFSLLKYLGAAYLIYIGYKSLTSTSKLTDVAELKSSATLSDWGAFKTGFLTNVLNPKVTLFFLSLFTLVLTPEIPMLVVMATSLIMIVNTIVWFSVVAVFISQKPIRKYFEKFQGAITKTFGVLLITLGIKVALTK